jgi:hypothetical protein
MAQGQAATLKTMGKSFSLQMCMGLDSSLSLYVKIECVLLVEEFVKELTR